MYAFLLVSIKQITIVRNVLTLEFNTNLECIKFVGDLIKKDELIKSNDGKPKN